MWEVLIASTPVFVMLLCWPETSGPTILYWRSARLRRLVGDNSIWSQAEVDQQGRTLKDVVVQSLLVPARITIQDPAILFANLYMMLVYGIYYSFFESFPLVYPPMYGFDTLQANLAFLPLAVGTVLSLAVYTVYLYSFRVCHH